MSDLDTRRSAVAEAIANLDSEGIISFDRKEPEYHIFSSLWEEFDSEQHLALLGIGSGIIDYQLAGDAQRFWKELEETAIVHGTIRTVDDVEAILDTFAEAAVNARFSSTKRDRLEKLFERGFADWFVVHYGEVTPLLVWERLAEALDNEMNKKTIVFAMKVYDIVHLIVNDTYLDLPTRVPIPCNLHVRRIADIAGIVSDTDDENVLQAWEDVAKEVSVLIGHDISLLRIDSIIWQSGQIVSDEGLDPDASIAALVTHYTNLGVDRDAARVLAKELTRNLR